MLSFKEIQERLKYINVYDQPILGTSTKTVQIYFNRLHKQIKFLRDIVQYGFQVGEKAVIYHLDDLGPGYIFITLSKNDDTEVGVAITKNSNKNTPKSHVLCLTTAQKFFDDIGIAIQPNSNKKLKDGTSGEKGFYVKAFYTADVMVKDEKRSGFILDMEPWQNKNEYAQSVNQNEITDELLKDAP